METSSYHSNQSSWTNIIKNTNFVQTNVISMYAKFQLHPPYGFWEEDFWIFFSKIYPLCCYSNQTNKVIFTKVALNVKDYSINIWTSTRQNVPSDILTLLVESSKKRKNDVICVIEIRLYLWSLNTGLPNEWVLKHIYCQYFELSALVLAHKTYNVPICIVKL